MVLPPPPSKPPSAAYDFARSAALVEICAVQWSWRHAVLLNGMKLTVLFTVEDDKLFSYMLYIIEVIWVSIEDPVGLREFPKMGAASASCMRAVVTTSGHHAEGSRPLSGGVCVWTNRHRRCRSWIWTRELERSASRTVGNVCV